jgi:hypothetical protein
MRFASLAARVVDALAIATFTGMFACVLGQALWNRARSPRHG